MGLFLSVVESFYGHPLFFNEIAGVFLKSLLAVSPEIQCPLLPRRHRSIVLVANQNLHEDILLRKTLSRVEQPCETFVK